MSKISKRTRTENSSKTNTPSSTHTLTNNQLKILQNNLHKHKERNHGMLSDPDLKQYAILLLQEQFWDNKKGSPTNPAWTLTTPTRTTDTQPRAVIYTNNNLIPPSQITPIALPFNDATT